MNLGQQFLKDEYQKRKNKNENFSLRSFARWLGTSPAQLSQMMSGKRPVSVKSIQKFSQKLELSPFEKTKWLSSSLETLESSQDKSQKRILEMKEDQFRMIADWYHFGILALSKLKNTKGDPRWVARQLGISFEDAHQAMLRLIRLQILETKPKLKQICEPIEVASDVPSEAIRKFHKQNLNLAAEKLESIPNHLREFQSISLALHPQQMKSLKKLIDQFLEQASEMENTEKAQAIYNLNVQLFPISKLPDTQEKQ